MIEAAVPPKLRGDASVQALVQAANHGDEQAIRALYDRFLEGVTDPQACDLLRQSEQRDASARNRLYTHFLGQVTGLVSTLLHPPQNGTPTHEATLTTDLEWSTLAKNIKEAAERLWRDNFLRDSSLEVAQNALRGSLQAPSARLETLRQLTHTSRQLMQLWLRTSLLRMRAVSNFDAWELQNNSATKGNRTRKQVARLFHTYHHDIMDGWDGELLKVANQRFFRTGFVDAQLIKTTSKEFGPDKVSDLEYGWAAQAPDAQSELRFQEKDELRRERWRAGKRVAAIWDWALKLTTGYGTKPGRFIWTVVIAIIGFGVAFFTNDALHPGFAVFSGSFFCSTATPHITTWVDVVTLVIHYLYLAITNLSSLGSDPSLATYCSGPSTQVLIALSALSGYFLLALLASLFYKQLTEAE